MSVDTSHRQFILIAGTLIERLLNTIRTTNPSLPSSLVPEPYPMGSNMQRWIKRLEVTTSGIIPKNAAEDEVRAICLGILNALKELVGEILTWNVDRLYHSQCQNGLMLGYFIRSAISTLVLLEHNVTLVMTGSRCERGCDDCLQSLKEEWSEAQADRNSIKLFLLVMFLQQNRPRLPRSLIIEMIEYAQANYWSHCPTIYQEALHALRLGEKVDIPLATHFLPR